MTRRHKIVLAVEALAVVAVGVFFLLPAKASRQWVVDHMQPATWERNGRTIHVRGVRNFSYDGDGVPTAAYYDAEYNLDSLESVWFVLTTFSKKWRVPAHTFLSFGFTGGRYVAVSVEARREIGESYGIFAGLLRQYELIYVIGDERDLIGRRAVVDGDNTYLYPVTAPRDKIESLFLAMLERSARLQSEPEFYNSLFNSCASNIIDHVNAVSPGRIPPGWKTMLPGYADDVAGRLGFIEPGTRARAFINARARAALGSDAFSTIIRTSSAASP